MLRIKLTLVFLTLLFSGIAQQFHFKNYSLEEGLSRSGVYYILQDHAGFLWIGTDGGGVCKYDGQSFENFTRRHGLASERIRIIFEDRNDVLWFGTDNGLSFIEHNQFITLTTEDGLSDNFIRTITQDYHGNLWVGTDRGVSIIDPSEREVSDKLKLNFNLPHHKIRSLLADSTSVWIGTDAGLVRYEDGKIKVITQADGLNDDVILSLFMDSEHSLWIGTPKGLSRIHNGEIESWSETDGMINNRVRAINEDVYNNIWIGTKKGVSIFDGNKFTNLDIENGLSNNRIRCIQTDNFNNIWLGTYFGGIMRFNYKDFISFTPKEGLISNQISTIAEDEFGDILVGSLDGVSRLKTVGDKLEDIEHITTKEGLISNTVQTIYKDANNDYWCGTDHGLTILKDEKIINISEENGLLNSNVTVINAVNDIYYIGTTNGLGELILEKDNTIKTIRFITEANGLAGKEVSDIQQGPNGQVWIGFADGGLSILKEEQLINPILASEVKEITSVRFDSLDRVWLGTNGHGLFYGSTSNIEDLKLINLSTKEPLTSDYIYSLLIHQNKIWVGHEKGLDLIDMVDDSTFSVQTFGLESGFLGLQNNRNASFLDHSGDLWFGTVNGLYSLRNKELNYLNEGEQTINYIKSVRVNGEHYDWTKSDYAKGIAGYFNLPVELDLPYDMNNMSFEFIAINYVFPEKIRYSWKLEGNDYKWTSLSDKNYCSYTNLKPGNYVFKLKTTNERGELLKDISTFEFVINKPFWDTWWFRILAIICASALVILFMSLRTKQLRYKQKVLEETISNRTEEITNQKNEIEKAKREIEEQHEELSVKNQEITDSILYSRRIQHAILPSSEKFNTIFDHYFIYYKPKDIVSGDFYWVEKNTYNANQIYFAVADCTGHGVPGAMVSLISTRALNSALLEHHLKHPHQILDKTNEFVTSAFIEDETGNIIKDGMDIALATIDYSNKDVINFEFAGAHNPAWIILKNEEPNLIVNDTEIEPNISNESHKLFIIEPNKQPIGHFEDRVPFKNNACVLARKNKVYLFSDGYADQFGGDDPEAILKGGKKYKYKPLKKFLLNIQHLSMEEQRNELEKEFLRWKQEIEQVDDVCFLGIEV